MLDPSLVTPPGPSIDPSKAVAGMRGVSVPIPFPTRRSSVPRTIEEEELPVREATACPAGERSRREPPVPVVSIRSWVLPLAVGRAFTAPVET